jgi:CBS domain containing-hemolysin-like protein
MIWPLLVGASILLNGFFAGMETGITSARRVRLVHWARQGRRGAHVAAELVRHRERSVVSAVVGNNVAIVAGTSLATAWAVAELGARGEAIAAVAMASLNIVFGEVLPKTTFRARPETLAVYGAIPFRFLGLILFPLQFVATWVARLVLSLFGERGGVSEEVMTRPRLLALFDLSRERRELAWEENRLLADFVGNSHRAVAEVMTPWGEVSRVHEGATVREVFDEVRRTGHSRLPVVRENGSVRGVVLYRDLQGMGPAEPIGDWIRDSVRIRSVMALDEALGVLTDRQVSLALVLGPDRAPVGVVTVEDLLEPFVGDIEDEHDYD